MRKIIAGFNMTLDGNCDHTAGIADDEIHQHYSDLLKNAGLMVWGRITYQLMESYWPSVAKTPTGDKSIDEFGVLIDNLPKLVFSHTLKNVDWKNTRLATKEIKEELLELKQQEGKNILIGSRSLIAALINLGLVDEFQLCLQPVIAGKGLSLFDDIRTRISLTLFKTKTLSKSGSIVLYYKFAKK